MPYNLTFYKISEKAPIKDSFICVLRERGGGLSGNYLSSEYYRAEYCWDAINEDDVDDESLYWDSDGLYEPGDIHESGKFVLSVHFNGYKLTDEHLWCYFDDFEDMFNNSQGIIYPPVDPVMWGEYYNRGDVKVKEVISIRDFKWVEGVHSECDKYLIGKLIFVYFIAEYKRKEFKMSIQYRKDKEEIIYLSVLEDNLES